MSKPYYYNARYYDPDLGRFITADTLVPDPTNLQAFNRYTYVLNNPIKYTDPTGHEPMEGEDGYDGMGNDGWDGSGDAQAQENDDQYEENCGGSCGDDDSFWSGFSTSQKVAIIAVGGLIGIGVIGLVAAFGGATVLAAVGTASLRTAQVALRNRALRKALKKDLQNTLNNLYNM